MCKRKPLFPAHLPRTKSVPSSENNLSNNPQKQLHRSDRPYAGMKYAVRNACPYQLGMPAFSLTKHLRYLSVSHHLTSRNIPHNVIYLQRYQTFFILYKKKERTTLKPCALAIFVIENYFLITFTTSPLILKK